VNPAAVRDAVLFYASFDKSLEADVAGGAKSLRTRSGALKKPTEFRFVDGYPEEVFRVASGAGVSGGALEAVDIPTADY